MNPPPTFSRTPEHVRSYKNLEIAIEKASGSETQPYNSPATRARIRCVFEERFGSSAHEWQVDVTEAILLGLDSFVIAGTGAGKTMPAPSIYLMAHDFWPDTRLGQHNNGWLARLALSTHLEQADMGRRLRHMQGQPKLPRSRATITDTLLSVLMHRRLQSRRRIILDLLCILLEIPLLHVYYLQIFMKEFDAEAKQRPH